MPFIPDDQNTQNNSFNPDEEQKTVAGQNPKLTSYVNQLNKNASQGNVAAGILASNYRNINEPKSGFQKGIEKVGQGVGFGLQTAGSILGQAMGTAVGGVEGGRKMSAIFEGAIRAGTTTIGEVYQNLVGQQDQTALESGFTPAFQGMTTTATDYAFNQIMDKAISPTFKKGKETVKKLLDKAGLSTNKVREDLANEIVSQAKNAYKQLNELPGTNAKQAFIDENLDKIPWWERVPNKWGNKEITLGESVVYNKISVIGESIEKIANQSGEKLNKETVEELTTSIPKRLEQEGYDPNSIKTVMGEIDELIKNKFKNGPISAADVNKLSSELRAGTYTLTGRGRRAIGPTAQRKLGDVMKFWIKDNVDGTADMIMQQRKLFLLNDVMEYVAPKLEAQVRESMWGKLAQKDTLNLATQLLSSTGLIYAGQKTDNKTLTTAGIIGGALSLPQLSRWLAGNAAKEAYKKSQQGIIGNITQKATSKPVGEAVETGIVRGITNLVGKGLGLLPQK